VASKNKRNIKLLTADNLALLPQIKSPLWNQILVKSENVSSDEDPQLLKKRVPYVMAQGHDVNDIGGDFNQIRPNITLRNSIIQVPKRNKSEALTAKQKVQSS
jgi:hypothetical protein